MLRKELPDWWSGWQAYKTISCMKILIELTYYRPHTSGLTIYSERLAKALANRGHQVTVLTSQFDEKLARDEWMEGVHIIRLPVLVRISKGVVMPSLGSMATKLVKEHDVIHLHLPQIDAAGIALRGRLWKKPTVLTYHCDLHMPWGIMSWLANQGVHIMNNLAALFTNRIVTYTQDYADNSPYLKRFNKKLRIIPPPVELPAVKETEIRNFGKIQNPIRNHPIIGMAARFASEKGVEVLLNAMPRVREVFPQAEVWFAGPYEHIMGEEVYFKRQEPTIQKLIQEGAWKFLGSLNPNQMAAFYPNIDMLVIPSLNSTEAFGLVQIEAMMNGKPSVASNLPGVRQPVLCHGMGKVVEIGDSTGLANAIIEIAQNPEQFHADAKSIKAMYAPDEIARQYEILFNEIMNEIKYERKTNGN